MQRQAKRGLVCGPLEHERAKPGVAPLRSMRLREITPRDPIIGKLDARNERPAAGLAALASEQRDASLSVPIEPLRLPEKVA